jgi:hypothetical protein
MNQVWNQFETDSKVFKVSFETGLNPVSNWFKTGLKITVDVTVEEKEIST